MGHYLQKLLAAYFGDACVVVKYCSWTHSAEQKTFLCYNDLLCVSCLTQVGNNQFAVYACYYTACSLLMIMKATSIALTSFTQKVILLTAGLSDLMTSCGPIKNDT
jgi:hypothetical protein